MSCKLTEELKFTVECNNLNDRITIVIVTKRSNMFYYKQTFVVCGSYGHYVYNLLDLSH